MVPTPCFEPVPERIAGIGLMRDRFVAVGDLRAPVAGANRDLVEAGSANLLFDRSLGSGAGRHHREHGTHSAGVRNTLWPRAPPPTTPNTVPTPTVMPSIVRPVCSRLRPSALIATSTIGGRSRRLIDSPPPGARWPGRPR